MYDLFYDMLTRKDDVNIKNWLENYSVRRTGSNDLKEAYVSLLKSCYGCPKNLITMSGAPGNTETQGSALASYPSLILRTQVAGTEFPNFIIIMICLKA